MPIPLLASRRTLVMTYEEGFKITDARALALHGVDTSALMARVVSIYAQVCICVCVCVCINEYMCVCLHV